MGPSGPWGWCLTLVFLAWSREEYCYFPPPPPGWDASPSQGYPQHICWYPFVHLDEEKHCESKVSCLRTQHNDPGQGSNLDHLIQSWARFPWGHCASTLTLYCREFANSWANLWPREVICMAVESSSLLNNFYCHLYVNIFFQVFSVTSVDGKTRVVVRGPDLKSFVIFEYVVGLCCAILENKCTKDA